MIPLQSVIDFLDQFAPPALAEEWDNVGLLLGDPLRDVSKVMTCLTITPSVVDEAVRQHVDLIVAHHPLPFRPIKRLTTETVTGSMILELAARRIAIHSPHTSFDSAPQGINQRLAEGLELQQIQPLVPSEAASEQVDEASGAGRFGEYPVARPTQDVVERLKQMLGIEGVRIVGDPLRPVRQLAVACGSAGEFLAPARQLGCDALLTGETNFHTCLDAESTGMGLLLVGHYASERFAVEQLADVLGDEFEELECWASRDESDPLRYL